MLKELEKKLLLGEAEDDKIIEGLSAALREAKSATLAMKIENGLQFDLVAAFQKQDGAASKFLSVMRGGPGTSDLNGLPAETPILVYAAKGDGERNANQARAFLKALLSNWLGIDVAISKEDSQAVRGRLRRVVQAPQGQPGCPVRSGEKKRRKPDNAPPS